MIEYWLPAAELVSAAVIGVCFLIAIVVINIQPAGRPRTFGSLGATLVLASTLLQALNGSLAGAYGRETVAYGALSVTVAGVFAGGLVLLALAVIGARRASRARGGR